VFNYFKLRIFQALYLIRFQATGGKLMNIRPWSVYGCVAFLFLFISSANAAGWVQYSQRTAKSGSGESSKVEAVSQYCIDYSISGSVVAAGDTNGTYGPFTDEDSFTFTATGNGTGTWRIVGDPSGVQTLASGGTFPGTLTFQVPLGQTQDGVGFYVDSYTGEGDTISGTCNGVSRAIPTLSNWSKVLMLVLLGSIGFAVFRRKLLR